MVVNTYLGLAAALAIVALAVWLQRNKLKEAPADSASLTDGFRLLRRPRFAFGTLGIFLYVGAEVTVGSLLVFYLIQADTMGISQLEAGKLVA